MSTYKLKYFNMMGRAEPTRLIFALANVDYEDIRIERSEWGAIKQAQPFGQLPVLEVDGQTLSQSRAIERFLAKKFELVGNSDWETAKMDEAVSAVEDLLVNMQPWFKEQDNAKKVEIFKTLCENEVLPFLTRFEHILEKNPSGYIVGDKISYADLAVFHIVWFMHNKILPGFLKRFSHVKIFHDKIAAEPKIHDWIEHRPRTDA